MPLADDLARMGVGGCGGCCLLTALILLVMSACQIQVGQVGVVTFLGGVHSSPILPGLNWVNPFASVVKFNTQTQIFHFADYVPTQEGVNVYLEASCLVHLDQEKAVFLYTEVGSDYSPVVLVPQLESVVREVTSNHTAAGLYSAQARQNMTTALRKELMDMVQPYGLFIESTPISKLLLPATITTAIEKKMTLQQEAEQMKFVLQKERQEAKRKIIEAQGIANYQEIIVTNTTDGMMRYNAIQATEQIASSCGAKLVLLGENGLPVIHSHKPEGDSTPPGVAPTPDQLKHLSNSVDQKIFADVEMDHTEGGETREQTSEHGF